MEVPLIFFDWPPGGAEVGMSVWFSEVRNTSNIQGAGFTRKTYQLIFASIWLCLYTLQFTMCNCILMYISKIYVFRDFLEIEISEFQKTKTFLELSKKNQEP